MRNMDGFSEAREKAFADEEPDTLTGVRCPECDSYLEEDGKWLYCLGCGYDEEEDSEE